MPRSTQEAEKGTYPGKEPVEGQLPPLVGEHIGAELSLGGQDKPRALRPAAVHHLPPDEAPHRGALLQPPPLSLRQPIPKGQVLPQHQPSSSPSLASWAVQASAGGASWKCTSSTAWGLFSRMAACRPFRAAASSSRAASSPAPPRQGAAPPVEHQGLPLRTAWAARPATSSGRVKESLASR